MKRFVFVVIAVLVFFPSCRKESSVSVTPSSAITGPESSTLTLEVLSNDEWRVSAPDDVIVSPLFGSGDAEVSITVPENISDSRRTVEVTFYCVSGASSQTVSIVQELPISLKVTGVPETTDFAGGEYTIKVDSNYPWTATAKDGLTISSEQGDAGISDVRISIPAYTGTSIEYRELNFLITAGSLNNKSDTTLKITQMAPNLLYGGESYKLTKLQDGRIWMAENLHFIPDGKEEASDTFSSKSSQNGIWFPTEVVDNVQTFDINGASSKGYLYTVETALGLKKGVINVQNAASYEGARGICPEGWHLPTSTEMINLVGKCSRQIMTNPEAPYYDDISKSGSIDKLEKDNWPIAGNIAGLIKNSTLSGTTTAIPKRLNNGCIISSSFYSGTVKSFGLMIDVDKGTIFVDYDIALSDGVDGVSVRCIMDAEDK